MSKEEVQRIAPDFESERMLSDKKTRIMKTVKVLIERGDDGTFGAYMPEAQLPFGVIGEGNTAEEAKTDFLNVIRAYEEDGFDISGKFRFEFGYDVPSFLTYYSGRLSLAGLERITGVARGQLSHYATGRRNPSPRTVEKIEKALQSFGEDLSQIHLI